MNDQVRQHLAGHAAEAVAQLMEFLRIPSVSGDSRFKADVRRAAEFVRAHLAGAGLRTEIVETAGHPIVYGEWLGAEGGPTALVYGHYDVQPPDPLDEWTTPAFEPDIRDGHVYARGATDDKGQMFTHVKAVEAWMKTVGRLPVNVKFVIEGEEEIGSRNLERFLDANREKVACDVAVVSDTAQFAPGVPAITYGLRGIIACEVRIDGPRQDLHSGVFGGAVANPLNALCAMIGKLHDDAGKVTVPGFYDDVVPLTDMERAEFARLPFDEGKFLADLGMGATWGEHGFTTLERRWGRPTCDVNGIIGGYTGEGPKTIVPAKASAKITCRLVPNQSPETVVQRLEAHLRSLVRPGLRMTFQSDHGGRPLVFDTSSPYMTAAKAAIAEAFGKEPVLIREGGSIPVVATFQELLGVETLLLGWGQNSDNLHSPNERFSLDGFHRGTQASAALWEQLARAK